MRIAAVLGAAALAFAAPALAQGPAAPAPVAAAAAAPAAGSTLAIIIAKGMTISVMGMDLDVAYKPDGTFDGGMFAGKYRTDGDKMCLAVDGQPDNCTAYPTGKKSGDSFEVPSDYGPLTIKIK